MDILEKRVDEKHESRQKKIINCFSWTRTRVPKQETAENKDIRGGETDIVNSIDPANNDANAVRCSGYETRKLFAIPSRKTSAM